MNYPSLNSVNNNDYPMHRTVPHATLYSIATHQLSAIDKFSIVLATISFEDQPDGRVQVDITMSDPRADRDHHLVHASGAHELGVRPLFCQLEPAPLYHRIGLGVYAQG